MDENAYVILGVGEGVFCKKEDMYKAFDIIGLICGLTKRGYAVEFVPIGEEEGYVAVKVQMKYFDKVSGNMYAKGFMLSMDNARGGEFVPTLLRMLEQGEMSFVRKLEQVGEEEEESAAKEE